MNPYLNTKLANYTIDLTKRPETYKTILKLDYGLNTETTKLRKKFSNLQREGFITNIPIRNTLRGRDILFYVLDKKYYIILANNDCYYCKNINAKKDSLETKGLHKLKGFNWIKIDDYSFDYKEVVICL